MTTQDSNDIKAQINFSFDEILNSKNTESIKILGVLLVNDSNPCEKIFEFYKNFNNILSVDQSSSRIKLGSIASLIDQQKDYIDSAFEICLNSMYIILINTKIDDENKLVLIKKFFDNFDFLFNQKNNFGRQYYQQERILKTLSRLFQIISPSQNQTREIDELKYLIYSNFKDFLRYHIARAEKIFLNYIIIDTNTNQYQINLENLKNDEKNIAQSSKINNELLNKIINILNADRILFKFNFHSVILICFLFDYDEAIPIILGLIDHFSYEIIDLEPSNEFISKKKFYHDLFKKNLLSINSVFELASSIKKKTIEFNDQAKQEITSATDHLESSANLLKSNINND